ALTLIAVTTAALGVTAAGAAVVCDRPARLVLAFDHAHEARTALPGQHARVAFGGQLAARAGIGDRRRIAVLIARTLTRQTERTGSPRRNRVLAMKRRFAVVHARQAFLAQRTAWFARIVFRADLHAGVLDALADVDICRTLTREPDAAALAAVAAALLV